MDLPQPFIERTESLLGEDRTAFEQALKADPPASIRINPSKYAFSSLDRITEKVRWSDFGHYLPERPNFTFDPLFHAGCYYPQEASSMFIEQAFRQYATGKNLRVLDLCAAPGGKSTHLLSLMEEGSLLVSNEVIRTRANILAENIIKWGYPNVFVTNSDPADMGTMKNYFDVILVDAPCSGEGMFRKDKDAVQEWSEANVRLCKERQRRIIADVWEALKTNGLLIYSTCTYNTEENEENVLWIKETFGAEILPLVIPADWNVTGALKGNMPVYRFFPHLTKGEGFFMAVIRKSGDDIAGLPIRRNKKREKQNRKPSANAEQFQSYLKEKDKFVFVCGKNKWSAIPSGFSGDYEMLSENLKVVSAGIEIGELKGKDLIPSHSLAMSLCADLSSFPTIEVDWEKAVAFLRKETFTFPQEMPKGYILLTYKGIPVGFMKNIGNRANNLYPQEWRIRTSYIPEEAVSIV